MDAWAKPKFALNSGIRPEDLAQAQAKAQNTNHVPLRPKVVYRYMFSRSTIANFIKIAKKNYACSNIGPKIQDNYNIYLYPKHQNDYIYAKKPPYPNKVPKVFSFFFIVFSFFTSTMSCITCLNESAILEP